MAGRLLPPGPPGRPIVGNLFEITRNPLGFLSGCVQQYGDIARYRVLNVTSFLLSRPEHIKSLLVDQNRHFVKGRLLRANRLLLGDGLATSEGNAWLKQRRLVQPAFHRPRVEGYEKVMVEYANRLAARWHDGDTIDLDGEMNRLAQQIAAKTLLDADVEDETKDVSQAFKVCLEEFRGRSRTAFMIPTAILTRGNLRLTQAVKQLDRVIYRVIRDRRASLDNRSDLLSMLLTARDEEGNGLSDRQLRDEVMTIFLAGHDPVGAALAWTWYMLAQRPRVEEKLLAELGPVLDGRAASLSDPAQLPYTEMVVRESLRLYPPIWGIVRMAVEDCEIGGYPIRSGDSVVASQWVTHRDPRYYEHPEEFVPERWSRDEMKRLPRFAYFPFGGGPRVCIGDSFALQELCLVLAVLVPRFHFELVDRRPVELLPSITLHPKNGLKVRVTRR